MRAFVWYEIDEAGRFFAYKSIRILFFFFYKNLLYKNVDGEIYQNFKNMLRTYPRPRMRKRLSISSMLKRNTLKLTMLFLIAWYIHDVEHLNWDSTSFFLFSTFEKLLNLLNKKVLSNRERQFIVQFVFTTVSYGSKITSTPSKSLVKERLKNIFSLKSKKKYEHSSLSPKIRRSYIYKKEYTSRSFRRHDLDRFKVDSPTLKKKNVLINTLTG